MGIDRRGFIKFAVGGAAGTLFTPLPWKLADDSSIWSQNWSWIPRLKNGEPAKAPVVCKLCPAGCGLDITTIGGRPVTAKGNPGNPLSKGGICPLGAASVQLLYSPSRVKGPMIKENGTFKPISWDDAKKMLADKLSSAKGSVALVSGDENGSATEVLAAFVKGLGSDKYFIMPSEMHTANAGWGKILNADGQVGYDIENADYVLVLGADALNSWGTVVRNSKAFAAGKANKVKLVYVGPVQNGTAAVADAWVPCLPGNQGMVAMGIASAIFSQGLAKGSAAGQEDFKNYVLGRYDSKKVSAETGVDVAVLDRIAKELAAASKPLVIVGSEFGEGLGAFQFAAGMSLNVMLNRVNQPGGVTVLPAAQPAVASAPTRKELLAKDFVGYMGQIAKGSEKAPEVILAYEANPAYALPQTEKMAGILDKSFLVSFSTFMDETAELSDLILPTPLYLERFDDAYTPYGAGQAIYSVGKPVLKPVVDAKNSPDVILEVAKAMGMDLGAASFEDVLKAKAQGLGADFKGLTDGTAWTGSATAAPGALTLWNPNIKGGPAKKAEGDFPVALAPVFKLNVGTDRLATPPFGLVTIREEELQGKEFFVQVNGATADKYGLFEGGRVTLTGPGGACKARVHISEGVMTNVVAIPMGFGRTAWDMFTKGKGDNAYKALSMQEEPETGLTTFAMSMVKIGA